MLAIARAVGAEGGLMQTVPNFGKVDEEMDLLAEEGESSRLLFSAIGEHREVLDAKVSDMRANGVDITAVTVPRSGGGVGGLATNNFWPRRRGTRRCAGSPRYPHTSSGSTTAARSPSA